MNRIPAAAAAAALSLALADMCGAPPAQAAPPPDAAPFRQPAGKWVVDYGLTRCTAARAYGAGKDALTFALRPSPGGTVVRLMLVRPGRGPDAVHVPVRTSITPATTKATALRFAAAGGKAEIVWINLDRPALDALSPADAITIRAGSALDERIALPGVGAVLKAMDRCNADLRAHWNAGGVEAGALSRPPMSVKPLPRYFSSGDYPAQAMNEGATGATRFTVLVDEKGVAADCMVEEASGIATLDAQVCALLQERAKFVPALDAAGKPARSMMSGRIRWAIAP